MCVLWLSVALARTRDGRVFVSTEDKTVGYPNLDYIKKIENIMCT